MKELSRLFRTYVFSSNSGWAHIVPKIEKLFNNTPNLCTGYTPFEIINGKNNSNVLHDCIRQLFRYTEPASLKLMQEQVRQTLCVAADRRCKSSKGDAVFKPGDFVLLPEYPVSDASLKIIYKFCPLYSGLYLVVASPYPNIYTLGDPLSNTKRGNYNITNLKLYYRPKADMQ